jgi:hypothetical protein
MAAIAGAARWSSGCHCPDAPTAVRWEEQQSNQKMEPLHVARVKKKIGRIGKDSRKRFFLLTLVETHLY